MHIDPQRPGKARCIGNPWGVSIGTEKHVDMRGAKRVGGKHGQKHRRERPIKSEHGIGVAELVQVVTDSQNKRLPEVVALVVDLKRKLVLRSDRRILANLGNKETLLEGRA